MAAKRWYTPSPEQEAVATELYELRKGRETDDGRELSQAAVAKACNLTVPKISEIESATRPPTEAELKALLLYYGVAPVRRGQLYELQRTKVEERDNWWLPKNDWVSDSLGYVMRSERRAEIVRATQGQYFPALLQTPGYRAELLRSFGTAEEKITPRLEVLLGRQHRFFSGDRPPRLHVVLAESLLDVGPRDVVVEQLEHLLKLIRGGAAEVRLVPTDKLFVVYGVTLMSFGSGRHIGYMDGVYESMNVVRMRDTEKLDGFMDRYTRCVSASLDPEDSCKVIEQHVVDRSKE